MATDGCKYVQRLTVVRKKIVRFLYKRRNGLIWENLKESIKLFGHLKCYCATSHILSNSTERNEIIYFFELFITREAVNLNADACSIGQNDKRIEKQVNREGS